MKLAFTTAMQSNSSWNKRLQGDDWLTNAQVIGANWLTDLGKGIHFSEAIPLRVVFLTDGCFTLLCVGKQDELWRAERLRASFPENFLPLVCYVWLTATSTQRPLFKIWISALRYCADSVNRRSVFGPIKDDEQSFTLSSANQWREGADRGWSCHLAATRP